MGDYKAALDLAKEGTENLSGSLDQVAVASGIAFAALSAQVYLSVKAFNEQERAVNEVNQALQNQGIYTDALSESYQKTAKAIEEKTGVDAAQILTAQASAQAILGQKKITAELTQGVVDFAARTKTDVNEAFNLIAKGVSGNSALLKRYSIDLGDATTTEEKLAKVTEVLNRQNGGFAESIANSSGSTTKLTRSFDDLEKALGDRLAPAFDAIVKGITEFFNFITNNKPILDFIASVTLAATVVTAFITAASVGATVFLQIKTAIAAAGLAAEAASIGFRLLAGATGIGLLLVIGTELYLNWSTIFPKMQQIYKAFVDFVIGSSAALGTVLDGVIHFDGAKIKAGLDQWAEVFKKSYDEVVAKIEPQLKTPSPKSQTQEPGKKSAADEEAARKKTLQANALAAEKAQNELLRLEDEGASKERIELKKQEIALLQALSNEDHRKQFDELKKQLDLNKTLQDSASKLDYSREEAIHDEILAKNDAYQSMSLEQQRAFVQKYNQDLKNGFVTRVNVVEEAAKKEADAQKKANNQFLLDQQKFGTTYAAINMATHSAVYEGTKNAFSNLADLEGSSNDTLKQIGKVAAIANIVVKTAEAAMSIYAGFATIPIIGPVLGVAGAAAAVAFGAEQVGKVQGAAQGGLIEGGTPGKDSVPMMAQQGELVAPRQNFEEVVGSVAAQRSGAKLSGGSSNNSDMVGLLQNISDKLDQRGAGTNLTIQGDVIGDPTFMEVFVRKLSDALEFGNGKLYGINAGPRFT